MGLPGRNREEEGENENERARDAEGVAREGGEGHCIAGMHILREKD